MNFHHNFLIKLQKSCYTAALVENFVATLPQVIFLRVAHFCSLYGNLLVLQLMASIRSQLFKDWILGWHKPNPEQLGPAVIRQLDKEPHLFVPLSFSVIRYLDMQSCDKSLNGHSDWTTRFLAVKLVKFVLNLVLK